MAEIADCPRQWIATPICAVGMSYIGRRPWPIMILCWEHRDGPKGVGRPGGRSRRGTRDGAVLDMRSILAFLVIQACLGSGVVPADDSTIPWWTVNGGGGMRSTAGEFEVSGTIGQPDGRSASEPMTGGDFELIGGFWGIPPCWCMSDVNNDGYRDGGDVQDFIDCFLAGGTSCACADLHTDGHLDLQDIAVFVNDLLAGGACP